MIEENFSKPDAHLEAGIICEISKTLLKKDESGKMLLQDLFQHELEILQEHLEKLLFSVRKEIITVLPQPQKFDGKEIDTSDTPFSC